MESARCRRCEAAAGCETATRQLIAAGKDMTAAFYDEKGELVGARDVIDTETICQQKKGVPLSEVAATKRVAGVGIVTIKQSAYLVEEISAPSTSSGYAHSTHTVD